ncbi:MAG: tetratricopeptide repeat protein [Acidobacteria bacterium]|nr:tetratricopeptide repeat protein [Acidobacteriota bacterium]
MLRLFVLLLLNSAYLAASAAPSLWYFANVALHPVLGLALAVAAARGLRRRFSIVRLKAPAAPVRPKADTTYARMGPLLALGALGLGAGFVLGGAVLILGATRPHRAVLNAHIALSTCGSILLAVHVWRTAARRWPRQVVWGYRVAVIGLFLAALAAAVVRAQHETRRRERYRIENPAVVPASMNEEGRGPHSPFFPSSADTNVHDVIPADFFLTSETCGRCHRDIYDQWNSSMHHFSSFNNQWYRKTVEYLQDVVGTRPSKWCAGCHDHAMLFNGRFDRPVKEQIDTPEAQAGLACTSCHSITRVKSTMGQSDFEIEYPPLHDLAVSPNPILRATHDTLLKLDPQPHRDVFLKPFHRDQTAEFCSSCHKVHLDVPVNGYRWFRGFNEYDNWQASGVSGEGARSFYYPSTPQTCKECHMPLVDSSDPAARDGKVRSHRFAAANTAVPFANGDHTQLEAVQDFLRDGQVTIDMFGLVRTAATAPAVEIASGSGEPAAASTFAVGEEALDFGARRAFIAPPAEVEGPFGSGPISVRPGESVRLEVVVRTRKVGHFFPGGTVDAFDVWVELEALDASSRRLFHSGALENGRGPVDRGAHQYRSLLLDARGNPINKRNAWAARSVAYVRLIPPGAADTIHYRLDIPKDVTGPIRLTARLNYRKFAWWFTQWAYAGVRDPSQRELALDQGYDEGRWLFTGEVRKVSGALKAIPDLPVTEMARAEAILDVRPAGAPLPNAAPVVTPAVRERWNDYGIGLLLQGDLKGAEAAFVRVTQAEPDYVDGWVNIGRVRVQEGNLEGAEEVLRKAFAMNPALARTHFFLAMALKGQGRYDEALEHLRQAASAYPRDRVVRNQLGRVLFLKRQFRDAVAEFTKVLRVDPEDLQAHYNLMLCYRGLGEAEPAAREQHLYLRFKADESAQAITGPYRRLNPEDNNERQPIHEHPSAPPVRGVRLQPDPPGPPEGGHYDPR